MAQQEKQHLFFGLLHLDYQRGKIQQTYVQNRTRLAKVASYETSQETSVSCTQLVVLYAPFQFGSEYNFLVYEVKGQRTKWTKCSGGSGVIGTHQEHRIEGQ